MDLHEFRLYKINDMAGGKSKFAQINIKVNRNLLKVQWIKKSLLKLQGAKFAMKVQNQEKFKLQRQKL